MRSLTKIFVVLLFFNALVLDELGQSSNPGNVNTAPPPDYQRSENITETIRKSIVKDTVPVNKN